jgi:hypothetical protein
MTEQLRLVDVPSPPVLTDRQQHAFDAIKAAGWEGLHHDELGAIEHERKGKHARGDRCAFCGQDGKSLGKELQRKGIVVQRRRSPASWTTRDATPEPASSEVAKPEARDGEWSAGEPVPYGTIPFRPSIDCAARVSRVRRAA